MYPIRRTLRIYYTNNKKTIFYLIKIIKNKNHMNMLYAHGKDIPRCS